LIFALLQQMLALGYRLFKRATDPLYRGLGLGLLLAICSCMVANCFGDRWTYLEISGPLWVLLAIGVRATHLTELAQAKEVTAPKADVPVALYAG